MLGLKKNGSKNYFGSEKKFGPKQIFGAEKILGPKFLLLFLFFL